MDRESRQVIRKAVGGFRQLDNQDWQEGFKRAADALKALRSGVEEGLRQGSICRTNDMLDFRDPSLAMRLQGFREEALREVNAVLRDAGLPPI